ncbi:MAG: 5-(carboxyamino)imidazole ribonucleotide mutase [Clostridiales bacterium]|jgi:5-(carboxyamino)imidazole ribonucleotide mutase|nr:5-(carboxyamino)imidazole ribonucleotide mutase [Clostridiales bacterium]
MAKKAAVLMGSASDFPVMERAVAELKKLGVTVECHIMSAHRTPELVTEFARRASDEGFGVIIAGAGKAAHLAGFCAAHTILPVIGVPLKSDALDGLDALLSTAQMPPGIPVAAVSIDGALNAAILAAQILAAGDPEIARALELSRTRMKQSVLDNDAALQTKY